MEIYFPGHKTCQDLCTVKYKSHVMKNPVFSGKGAGGGGGGTDSNLSAQRLVFVYTATLLYYLSSEQQRC